MPFEGGARWSRVVVASMVLAVLATCTPARADASACGRDPADLVATAEVVAAARAACSCASFATRLAFRQCVRGVVESAIQAKDLAKRCRNAAMRYARTATCGAKAGKVTCCKGAGGSCSLADSTADCEASRGGTGTVGNSESCYDACTETPMPTPGGPTPTPGFPTPSGGGQCCACGCAPPYYLDCSGSVHQCTKPAPGATSNEDCDALDVAGRLDCEFLATCNTTSGGIPFPYCN